MEYNRENLNKLSLVELKVICKNLRLKLTGTKSQLIKSIIDLMKPQPEVVSIPKDFKIPRGKKIIGLKLSEHDKRIQIGKLRQKNNVTDLYYSMGVHYYIVDKDFKFD